MNNKGGPHTASAAKITSSTTSIGVPDDMSLVKFHPDSFWLKAKQFVRRNQPDPQRHLAIVSATAHRRLPEAFGIGGLWRGCVQSGASRGRIWGNGLVIGDGAPTCPLEVVVLAVLERPEKTHQADGAEC